MSVPVWKRSDNKLQAIVDVNKMCAYAMQMCENEKVIPKKCRWYLCTEIMKTCIHLVSSVRQINKIRIDKDIETAEMRMKYHTKAMLELEALWSEMTIAKEMYNVPNEKIDHWSQLALKADDSLSAWRNSDRKRVKELKETDSTSKKDDNIPN